MNNQALNNAHGFN